MPLDAIMAQIWWRSPRNPDEFEDWPADKLFQYMKWIQLDRELSEALD